MSSCDICGHKAIVKYAAEYETPTNKIPLYACFACFPEVEEEISKVHGIDRREIEFRRLGGNDS
jgi:DNA-directed RNA polymerase subunit RPC12/RpoP